MFEGRTINAKKAIKMQ